MKDIVITAKKLVREAWVWLGCFVVANGVNVSAIVTYNRPWTELYSQIGFVVAVSIAIYLLLWIVRAIVALVRWLIAKIKR